MNKPFFLLIFFLLTCSFGWCQKNLYAWESDFALNYRLNQWKFNSSIGHRTIATEFDGEKTIELAFLELNQFISTQLAPRLNIAAGYKYRKLEPLEYPDQREHRTTLQVAYQHNNNPMRFISRIRTEQRFKASSNATRFRYRISSDLPLNGNKLDSKEFFMVVSNELLFELENKEGILENRSSIGLGYSITKNTKLQATYTLRAEGLNQRINYVSFIATSIVLRLY